MSLVWARDIDGPERGKRVSSQCLSKTSKSNLGPGHQLRVKPMLIT